MNSLQKIEDVIAKITGNSDDIIVRDIHLNNHDIKLIYSEVLSSSDYINDYVLKNISRLSEKNFSDNLYELLYNTLPSSHVKEITTTNDIINYLYLGYAVLVVDIQKYIAIEAKATLDRGISEVENEVSIIGAKDAFTENFNKNLGLIRKRIRSSNLYVETLSLGKESQTKVGVCYMNNIVNKELVAQVKERLSKISIDVILDSGYLRENLIENETLFPVINTTERPDTISFALLEGKVIILVDNTPYALIIPTFFVDFFHAPDDYYQKPINTTFIRLLRFIAFSISIFLPAFYISITTHNTSSIPITLLLNFTVQRQTVPFPSFIEAILMIVCFEILRESDIRIPSKIGSSISILGGLILGEAAVNAGIISPIMIIVIAISAISALVFTSNSMINAIRYYRFLFLVLATFLGLYGVFVGFFLLVANLSSVRSFHYPYLAPISPFIKDEIDDSFIKRNKKGALKRNPLLASKNIVRGRRS